MKKKTIAMRLFEFVNFVIQMPHLIVLICLKVSNFDFVNIVVQMLYMNLPLKMCVNFQLEFDSYK